MAKFCQSCGAELEEGAKFCNSCGAALESNVPSAPGPQSVGNPQPAYRVGNKNRSTAGILGILLGGLGAHKFYLGKTGKGILYLLLCWTFVPGIIGFIEGIQYLLMSDEEFDRKFNY